MDPKRNFTDEDKAKTIKFLNMVAKHARFDVKTDELIEYFKHLSFMQQILLPKIDSNILEFKRVIEPEDQEGSSQEEDGK